MKNHKSEGKSFLKLMIYIVLNVQSLQIIKKITKREINGKINPYSYFINCAFRKFETTDQEK